MLLCHQSWPGFALCPLLTWLRGQVTMMPCSPHLCWACCEERVCVLRSSSFPGEHWQVAGWALAPGAAAWHSTCRGSAEHPGSEEGRLCWVGCHQPQGAAGDLSHTVAGAATPVLSPLQARNSTEGHQIIVEFDIPTMGLTFVSLILKHFIFSLLSQTHFQQAE